MSLPPPLALLYSPASRPELVVKALAGPADAVIVDLEDAVAPTAKDSARAGLAAVLTPHFAGDAAGAVGAKPVQVRINAPNSPWFAADVAAVAALPRAVAVRVPKAEDPRAIAEIAGALPGRKLYLLVESALGVENAYALARAHANVAGISLGEADLRSELGLDGEDGLAWIRGRIVVAARAGGLPAPVMAAYTSIRDLAGLAQSCAAGKRLGFLGRTVIHPAQIPVVREAFLPTAAEVARAHEVLAKIADAYKAGTGAFALADGTFLDAAMVGRAQLTVNLADATCSDFPAPSAPDSTSRDSVVEAETTLRSPRIAVSKDSSATGLDV